MLKQLRRRLIAICTVITGIILIGMAGASLFIAQSQLDSRGEAAFQSDVNAVLFHIRSQSVLDYTWLSQTEVSSSLILSIAVDGLPLKYPGAFDRENRRALANRAKEIAWKDYGYDGSVRPKSGLQPEVFRFTFKDEGRKRYYAAAATIPVEKNWISVVIVKSMEKEMKELAVQRWLFGAFTLLSLLFLFAFAWVFTGRAIRPLEENRRKQIEFVAAASHELRAPLAVVRASLSAMKGAPQEDAERFYQAADSECSRMSRLIGDLLTLAGADGGTWSIQKEETEVETLLLTVCESFEPPVHSKEQHLIAELPQDSLPRCRCDAQRIVQVLSILIDNAVSYTPAGGQIRVAVRHCGGELRFEVADNGQGISEAEKTRVFERFYRRDDARKDREHYGLGLCIAEEIVALHKGRLFIEDTPGGGATFVMTLPL